VFDSGELVDSAEYRFQYTFDSRGIYYYVYESHVQYGTKGAVFVALDEE
jgi:plastocyanin